MVFDLPALKVRFRAPLDFTKYDDNFMTIGVQFDDFFEVPNSSGAPTFGL